MRNTLLLLLFGVFCSAWHISAQTQLKRHFDPQLSYQEFSLQVGLYTPLKGDTRGGTVCYALDYASYGLSNFGFHVGLLYLPEIQGVSNMKGIPLGAIWRSKLRGSERLGENWSYAAVSAMQNPEHPLMAFLLVLLPQRYEINAGFTPGYIFGKSYSSLTSASWIDNGAPYQSGVHKRYAFTTTFDVGFALNYRIWRFFLKLHPQYHYFLTDNFRYTAYQVDNAPTSRSYISFTAELGYLF
jgi:hypothetical protein